MYTHDDCDIMERDVVYAPRRVRQPVSSNTDRYLDEIARINCKLPEFDLEFDASKWLVYIDPARADFIKTYLERESLSFQEIPTSLPVVIVQLNERRDKAERLLVSGVIKILPMNPVGEIQKRGSLLENTIKVAI